MHLIKHIPEDFIVKEKISLKLADAGIYSCFLLKKKNLSTHEAAEIIADRLNVPLKNIGYCGNKDKRAVTEQAISINSKGKFNGDYDFGKVKLKFLGFLNEPISLGDNEGNEFEIIVRNLDEVPYVGKVKIQVPNYFDEQRFSDNNFEVGLAVLKKEFGRAVELILNNEKNEKINQKIREILESQPRNFIEALKAVPKKQRMIYVHSVQSYVFNELVVRLILAESGKFRKVRYSLGELVFPEEKFENRILPIVGFDEPDEVDSGTESELKTVLGKIGLQRKDFLVRQIPDLSAESGLREMFAESEVDFSTEDDELNAGRKKCLLRFSLPKGSYATIVVKKVFGH